MILLTHSFLDYEGKRFITENYQMQDVNYAEALWQKLVYPSDNIKLVICGHECHITDYAQQVSFRTDKNHSGNEVAQMMFNAQTALQTVGQCTYPASHRNRWPVQMPG